VVKNVRRETGVGFMGLNSALDVTDDLALFGQGVVKGGEGGFHGFGLSALGEVPELSYEVIPAILTGGG
jgi:hypothetical protein